MKLIIINGRIASVLPDDAPVAQGDELFVEAVPMRYTERRDKHGIVERHGLPDIGGPAPLLTGAALLRHIRKKRDRLLTACDWRVMPDSPLTDEQRAAWSAYRRKLRDFPATAGLSQHTPWPTPPTA